MSSINDLAPQFTLKNTKKEDVSLSDFSDKVVVLAFYPGAFTGVCDSEMCALQDNLKSFNELDAVVLGISVDSPWADFERKVINDYNVVFTGLGGIEGYTCANRAVFIIKDGVIKYRWDAAPNPGVEPDYDEIKNQLESI